MKQNLNNHVNVVANDKQGSEKREIERGSRVYVLDRRTHYSFS